MTIHETLRHFDFLGGQRVPRASDGVGKKILYRCGACQRIWLQDGARITLELAEAQVQALARELGAADLASLPVSPCRLCLYRTGGGVTEIDEYGKGKGFGWSWEYLFPHPIHALLTVTSTQWLRNVADVSLTLPDVVTRPRTMRAVLAWFVELEPPHQVQRLDSLLCSLLRQTNPPGYGQPGTEAWQWSGWRSRLFCAPLQGPADLMLTLALPPEQEESTFTALFSVWQSLAFLTLLGSVTGNSSLLLPSTVCANLLVDQPGENA